LTRKLAGSFNAIIIAVSGRLFWFCMSSAYPGSIFPTLL